jgi:DNA-binding beta-propeller fold protein YncE
MNTVGLNAVIVGDATICTADKSHRTVKSLFLLPVLPLVLLMAGSSPGCTAASDEVRPPVGQLFFPTGLAQNPTQSNLLVANGNSELRYDSGSVAVLDLAKVDQVSAAWVAAKTIPAGCKRDALSPETLECDEAQFINQDQGVRVGNFATNLAVQDFGSGNYRVIVPVRGDPSVTWIDGSPAGLRCDSGNVPFALCGDEHRLTSIQNDSSIGVLNEEPFAVYADSAAGFAVVAHLTTGALTLLDSRPGAATSIVDVVAGVFGADENGLRGASAVTARTPGDGFIYAVSRSDDRVQLLTVNRQSDGTVFLLPSQYFFLDAVGGGNSDGGGSRDSRGIAFSQSGNRMFVLNRQPPSVQLYDTSLDVTGFPKNRAIAATDVCRAASSLTVANVGDGDRAYVSCFNDGTINVVDPRNGTMLTDVITVGRGPYAISVSDVRRKLYVSNFLEDTIGVVDIAPESPFRNRVVLRIGERRQ